MSIVLSFFLDFFQKNAKIVAVKSGAYSLHNTTRGFVLYEDKAKKRNSGSL